MLHFNKPVPLKAKLVGSQCAELSGFLVLFLSASHWPCLSIFVTQCLSIDSDVLDFLLIEAAVHVWRGDFQLARPLCAWLRVTDVCCGRMRRVNTCRAVCPMRTIFRSWWKRYHSCGGLHLGSVPLLLQHPDELRFAWHLLLCCRFCIWIPWNTESVGPLFSELYLTGRALQCVHLASAWKYFGIRKRKTKQKHVCEQPTN